MSHPQKAPTMSTDLQDQAAGRVLVIEDEADIRDIVRHQLERQGFHVETAADGERGLELARGKIFDVVLLDLMLPGLSGLEVCRFLRDDPRTASLPILMVTSRSEESDVVDGLNAGADDYIPKPFSTKELVARVRATVRRNATDRDLAGKKPLRRGILELDPVRHEVRVNDQDVHLTLSEFRLLHHLMRHPGRVFSRSDLLPHVVGQGVVVVDRNIDVHVRNLRRKLGNEASSHISTVRGLGYKFEDR